MPPADPARASVARFALLALAAASATALLFLAAVHTAWGQRIDDAGRVPPGGELSPADEATRRLLDTISVSSLVLLGVAIMLVAVLRDRPWLAAGAGVLVLGANLTTQWMKAGLDRPALAGEAGADAGAFPSGHVTVAASLAMALVLVSPPALRWPAALLGGAYASGIGVAVLALGWHRPSEVVGAYLVVVGWTAVVAGGLVALRGPRELGAASGRPRRAGAIVAAVLAVAFAGVVAVAAHRRLDLSRVADDRTALTVASVLCVGACAALVTMTTGMLQALRTSRPRRRTG